MTVTLSGHVIKATEIVGIGPLEAIKTETQLGKVIIEFYYVLHLRNNSPTIKSVWEIHALANNEKRAAIKLETEEWQEGYEKAKELVIKAIHADLP